MDDLAIRMASRPYRSWAALVIIALDSVAVVLMAPAEATIGNGIRIVYIHVALIWSGLLLLLLAGLLGLLVLLLGPSRPEAWMRVTARIGQAYFAAGVLTSLVAEIVNWGGIAWREPRTSANLNLLALAILVQVSTSWFARSRLRGGLNLFLGMAAAWTTLTTDVQLHPANAVGESTSSAIQLAFYGLTILLLLAATLLILIFRGRQALAGTAAEEESAAPESQ
jgi:hypothetical protein